MSSLVVQMTQEQLKSLFIEALRDTLGGTGFSASAPVKGKRGPKKEKDPDAPKREPNDWIKFTSRVRSVLATEMEEGKKVAPKAVTQTASSLKEAGLMGSATDEQIRAAYKEWLANPPAVSKSEAAGRTKKSKASTASDASSTASSASGAGSGASGAGSGASGAGSGGGAAAAAEAPKKKRGPKKLTDMTPEERAAHDAKKEAKKAAKKGGAAPSAPAAEVVAPSEDGIMDFEPFTWKKMSLLKNNRGDVLTEEMEWFGHWDEKANKVDTSAPQPADLDLA